MSCCWANVLSFGYVVVEVNQVSISGLDFESVNCLKYVKVVVYNPASATSPSKYLMVSNLA